MSEMIAERNIEKELASLLADMEKQFAEIRGTLRLHTWMLATNIALTVAVLFRVLSA